MKGLFPHPTGADPGWLAEELPGPGRPLTLADRACCCPARPVVTVMMPPAPGRPFPADLLLCGHHYRANRAALLAAGATIYDADGTPIAPGDGWGPEDCRQPGDRPQRQRQAPATGSASVQN